MTFNRVKELRKSGQLDEALSMAMEELNAAPNNIWNKRSLFWVLYEFLMKAAEEGDSNTVFAYIDRINEIDIINLPEEGMARTFLFKCIKELFRKKANSQNNHFEIEELANRLCDYSWSIVMTKPSPEYSAFLDAFLPIAEQWGGFIEFVEKWDFKNLTEEDYQLRTIFHTKKQYMSLAETAYIAYSKVLLSKKDLEKMRSFQLELDKLADNPMMTFLGYFNAKLLFAMNSENQDVLNEVLPFARRKRNEYWVWQFLSEVLDDDEQKWLACMLRAVHCKTKEDYLPKIRQKLINYYYERNDLPRAKFHIEKYVTCRLENGYSINPRIQQIQNQYNLDSIKSDASDPIDYLKITNEILGVQSSNNDAKEKKINGIIQSNKAKTALFVKSKNNEFAFIPRKLSKGLTEGDHVQASIIENIDPKRNQKSWICTKIKKNK